MCTITLIDVQFSIINDRVALAKQGDNALGSIRPSDRGFVCLFVCLRSPGSALPSAAKSNWSHYQSNFQGVCLCVCNQWAYADNRADAINQLFM